MAKKNEKPNEVVKTPETPEVVKTPETPETPEVVENEFVGGDEFETIIHNLLKNKNCKRVHNLTVKNVTIQPKEDYTSVVLTIWNKIPGYVSEVTPDGLPTGVYKLGLTNMIYSSTFALSGCMKNNETVGFVANATVANPKVLAPIMTGSVIDIIQQSVKAGEEYINPFTTKSNPIPTVFEHDTIVNHIVKVNLGPSGKIFVEKVLDKFADSIVY